MTLVRSFLMRAARRAASDPRVRAKAKDVYQTQVQPRMVETSKTLRKDWEEQVSQTRPSDNPMRFAGRMTGRVKKRLQGRD